MAWAKAIEITRFDRPAVELRELGVNTADGNISLRVIATAIAAIKGAGVSISHVTVSNILGPAAWLIDHGQ